MSVRNVNLLLETRRSECGQSRSQWLNYKEMEMREIKFRAWDTIGEYMYANAHGGIETRHGVTHFEEVIGNQLLILMQYTGLKDKNGKEIYEGDVVKYKDDKDGVRAVLWSDKIGAFVIGRFNTVGTSLLGLYFEEMEIIGNIYENPELLEDKP